MAKRKRKQVAGVDIDIVIPVYGQFDSLKETIDALPAAAAGLSYRLILVDDMSPAFIAAEAFYPAMIKKLGEQVSIIYNKQNNGYPYSVNLGVAHGAADTLLLLNSDVQLTANAIKVMYETLQGEYDVPHSPVDPVNDMGIGVVAPKLVFADDTSKIQHAGVFFDLWATPVHRFIGWSTGNGLANKAVGLQAVSGACLMTKRVLWNKILNEQRANGDRSIGAMNQVYGRGTYEDMEYCVAARANGYRVVYQPLATGTHKVGASAKGSGGYPLQKNRQIFMARCGHLLVYDEWMVT